MKRNFKIIQNSLVATLTYRLVLESVEPGYVFSGEFVDIAIPGFYLRRPISVCDYSDNKITLLYKVVGEGTKVLSAMEEGETLELLTGLGRGWDAGRTERGALLVAGGLGAAPLLPLARELKSLGKKVTVVLGFNREDEIVLEKEFAGIADCVALSTLDGSRGTKGFVTDAIAALKPDFDCFYTCGPLVMMKAVCEALEGPGQLSLEERMGCGAGFCYGCSCKTLLGTKRICKDGPVFNREEMIW